LLKLKLIDAANLISTSYFTKKQKWPLCNGHNTKIVGITAHYARSKTKLGKGLKLRTGDG